MLRTSAVMAVVVGLCACGGDDDGGGQPVDGGPAMPSAIARFEPPAAGAVGRWGALPYPSDYFLDGDGRLVLEELPVGPDANAAMVQHMKDSLRDLDGAGVSSSVYFPIDGELDADTLAGHVHLVDLDGGAAEVPLELRWRADLGAIVGVPRRGHVLRQARRYAAYVTDGVKAADGGAVGRSPAFAAALEGGDAQLAPLLAALDSAALDSLVVATVFTTADLSGAVEAMRDIVAATPPVASVLDVWGPDATELDALFGVQADDAVPGFDYTDQRPQPRGNVGVVLHGSVGLTSFLSATPGEAGFITFDGDGAPEVKGVHPVKFTLTLPKDTGSYADTPVVIYQHGLNRTRLDMLTQVDTAARAGMAVLAIDVLYHGDRSPTTRDVLNDLTGATMSDGFGDLEGLFPAVNFFHLTGGGGIPPYHPGSMRDNLRQAAADVCSMVAFVRAGDLAPINEALSAAGLSGDLSFLGEVALLSESFGAMIGAVALAVEPDLGAAFLSSIAAGFPYPSMLHSANFSGTFADVVLSPFDLGERVVLGDPDRGARFEPIVMFWNNVLERGDPTGYAPYLFDGSLRGDDGPNLILTESYADEWVPNEATEAFAAAAGLPTMTLAAPQSPPEPGLRFVSLPEVAAPQSGNTSGGARTAVHTLWYPAPHAVLRKLDDAREYESDLPPFPKLDTPEPYVTPTAMLHRLWSGFFTDQFDGGGAPVAFDPYAL